MSNSGNSSQVGLFCLSIITTFLISGVIPQQVIAAEIDPNTTNEKEHELAELAAIDQQSKNSSGVTTLSSLQSLSKEAKLIQALSKNNNSKELNSIPLHTNSQTDVSYDAADLQLEGEFALVEKKMEEQLLTRQVDIDTFCRNYPLNSRCANYQPPQQQRQEPAAQPAGERQSSGYAITGKVSTLGFGIEGTGAISPNFNGRLGFNYFDFGINTEQADIDYDADVRLLSATALVDWFPSRRSEFRLTGGLAYNNNKVEGTARSAETLEIGGVEFPLALVGQLEGELTFPNTISPYIGIGYGNPVRQGRQFGFSIDLGILFAGSPQVDLNATGPVGTLVGAPVVGPFLQDALRREEEDLEDELRGLRIYPVLSIGVSYQF